MIDINKIIADSYKEVDLESVENSKDFEKFSDLQLAVVMKYSDTLLKNYHNALQKELKGKVISI